MAERGVLEIVGTDKYEFQRIDVRVLRWDIKPERNIIIKDYLRLYRPLRPLFYVLKVLLYYSYLTDPT